MNAIDSIIAKLQINFKTQKYNENLIFVINIINLKIVNKIIFKRYKILIIIKIYKNQKFNKIVINKFARLNIKRCELIIKNNLLTFYYITFANVFLDNVFNEIYIYNFIKNFIKTLLI